MLSCGASGTLGSGGTGGRHGLGITTGWIGTYAIGPSRPLRAANTDPAPGGSCGVALGASGGLTNGAGVLAGARATLAP